jgi:hypothetical protein
MKRAQMAGLGFEPITMTTVILAAIALLGGWAIIRELRLIWQGAEAAGKEAKGYIEQTKELVEAGGGVIEKTGNTALKVAAAVAIVGGLYLAYRWISGRRRGGSAPSITSTPAKTFDLAVLKPAEAKVIA